MTTTEVLLRALERIAYGLEMDGRTADGLTRAAAAAIAREAIAKAEGRERTPARQESQHG